MSVKLKNFEQFEEYLTNVRDFTYRHCEAYWTDDHVYVVKDYGTVLLRQKPGRILYFDNTKYSSTTSKIQSTIKRVFGIKGMDERKVYDENN